MVTTVKGPGGRVSRRLADMGIYPKPETYRPPKGATERTYEIPLPADGERLTIRHQEYRGKTVDFAITQETPAKRRWSNVARIDCCGGTIHEHLFDKAGNKLKDHLLICEIPLGEAGWEVVNAKYPEAYEMMEKNWEDNLRRWNGDSCN